MVTACINLAELWSPKDLFYATLSAVMGVFIGLWLSTWQTEILRIHRIKQLKLDLLSAFQFNLDRIHDAIDQLKNGRVPNFQLDDLSVTHILYSGRELFESKPDFDAFNWQRFQLQHINSKLAFIYNSCPSGSIDTELVRLELSSLVDHLEGTGKNIAELIAKHQKANK